jgi:predicted nucleic acid-binding protein
MLVIADTGALISLGHIDKLYLIEELFGEVLIPEIVLEELKSYRHPDFKKSYVDYFSDKVKKISSINYFKSIIDIGESEAMLLYMESDADYLLIDDKNARRVAESLDISCIGSIGVLVEAKNRNLIDKLKPLFEKWLTDNRYFSKQFLNIVLKKSGEGEIL